MGSQKSTQKSRLAATEADPLTGRKLGGLATLKDNIRRKDFLIVWLSPVAIFLTISLIWTYGFLDVPTVCIVMLLIGLGLCAALASDATKHIGGVLKPTYVKQMALLGIPALLFGALTGLYCFDQAAIFPMLYRNTRTYTNVLPSQPSAAVEDAGKLVFASGSAVATSLAAGLTVEDGTRYCVAPISDGQGTTNNRIQFWAAGVDCCSPSGEFYCDAVSDASARAGIVVFDNNGWFEHARYDFYVMAGKKAQAEFSLQTVSAPIFVRWVTEGNLDMLSKSYKWKAIIMQTIAVVVILVMNLCITMGIIRLKMPVAFAHKLP